VKFTKLLLLFIALLILSACDQSEDSRPFSRNLNIAVASNFAPAMNALTRAYPNAANDKIRVIAGSTGKLYAQIKNGAPFDLFFAADSRRPELLQAEGLVLDVSPYTYAIGKLVLWSPAQSRQFALEELLTSEFRYLAIANPRLAPYGEAAQQVLQVLGFWNALQDRLVIGESIGQAYQFVDSGNADLGLLALSQFSANKSDYDGYFELVPDTAYTPIKQQVVLLNDNSGAHDFLRFVKSGAAKNIVRKYGYGVP
jgi:molybdate transport system substrate-binding protein